MSWLSSVFPGVKYDPDLPNIIRTDVRGPVLPKPRLAAVNQAPSREDFAAWRDEPTTRFIFAALRTAAAVQQDAWLQASWHGAEADPILLTELRTRADAYEAMEAGDYEAFCAWAGVEPEQEEQAA